MSDHAQHPAGTAAAHGGHDDPMSYVPPGSIWPFLVSIALILIPFGSLAALGALKWEGDLLGFVHLGFVQTLNQVTTPAFGNILLGVGGVGLLFTLMGWAHQIIREKPLSHDPVQQQSDLKMFTACFLTGELAIFGAIFGYFYHRKIWDASAEFTLPEGMHFHGALVAYATFILISSSVTCEMAHHFLEHGKRGLAKLLLLTTIVLGVIFLGFQGKEYGELIARGFTPAGLATTGHAANASFASIFYTSTGFHGLHVAIGLIMLFMVLMRLEFGHFKGKRNFAMIAASWYWHFVDIVWILLFITVYVVG